MSHFNPLDKARNKLLLHSSLVISENKQGKPFDNIEQLCLDMSAASYKYQSPISSSFNGEQFVVDKNQSPKKVMEAYIDQCLNLNDASYEQLNDILCSHKMLYKNTPYNGELNFSEMMATKSAETIIRNYPEHAKNLDLIQISDVYHLNFNNVDSVHVEPLLRDAALQYIRGDKKIEPTIYNVSKMHDVNDFIVLSGMSDTDVVNKLQRELEDRLLSSVNIKSLDDNPKGLDFTADIAQKHMEHPNSSAIIKAKSNKQVFYRHSEKTL